MNAPAPHPVRLVLVEDQPSAREELADLFDRQPGMLLLAALSTACSAVEELPRLQPDVVVMDHYLPDGNGVDCVRHLRPLLPKCEFMMLTVAEEQALIFDALKAGATGYVVKGESGSRICEAILELAAGGSPMSASIARKVISEFSRFHAQSSLSAREREILHQRSIGLRYKEIAAELNLSVHTVKTHLHKIYRKLETTSKQAALQITRHSPE